MNFVGDQGHTILLAEFCDPGQFVARPNLADRVMRIAHDHRCS